MSDIAQTSEVSSALDPTRCWQAVQDRDRGADGAFVYAVRSTGIYCRPSCPSRRPGPEQASFFAGPDAAERAGFRACRRCRPDETAADAALAARICRYIEGHLDESLDLGTLAADAGRSPSHLQRTFKRLMGVSPREYADARRMERFRGRIQTGAAVTDAMLDAGYTSSSRLYERTPAHLGMTPRAYRKGGEGLAIRHITADCPLGRLLVAATPNGICAVALGDTDEELLGALRREFPAADLVPDDGPLGTAVDSILRHLAGEQSRLDLALDLRATAFQRRVWSHLQTIAAGARQTYGEVARALDRPSAARAVGRACAANPVALVIPCHRVVRGDGDPGGYRWGIERKRRLLRDERDRAG